jgi:hypothetical protein
MNIKMQNFMLIPKTVAKVAKKFLLKSYDCKRVPTNYVVFHLLARFSAL